MQLVRPGHNKRQQQPSASGRPVTAALLPSRRPVATTAATRSDPLMTSGGGTVVGASTATALRPAQPADRRGNLIPAQNGATSAGRFPSSACDPRTGRTVSQRPADCACSSAPDPDPRRWANLHLDLDPRAAANANASASLAFGQAIAAATMSLKVLGATPARVGELLVIRLTKRPACGVCFQQ